MSSVRILAGDCRESMRGMPAESVHCCVTSPPYWNLRDYKHSEQIGMEESPEAYIAALVEVFREVRRVLRPDGTAFLNLGDAYANDTKWGGSTGGKHAAGLHGETDIGRMKRLTGLKPKDLMLLPHRVALALQAEGWWVRSDCVWCLSGGTRIYARTQKGEMPTTIKDLVRLDPATVQLWNGERWTQVLGWSETPRPTVAYELELRSGERIGCTAGHLWPTTRGNVRADELKAGDVIQTCRLPEPVEPVRPTAMDDAMVGWFVGLYLAEGCRYNGAISISGHVKETERLARLRAIAAAYHSTCAIHGKRGLGCKIVLNGPVLNGIIDTYISGERADGKHLNVRVWQRSDAFLKAVLEGYLSGDGHYDAPNQRWRLGFCQNDSWTADLRTICARLGISLRLRRYQHQMNGRRFPGYRGEIRFGTSGHWNAKQSGEVIAIRKSRARKFWDIGVADEPHLFSLASGVLTHNSKNSCMPESLGGWQWERCRVKVKAAEQEFSGYGQSGNRRIPNGSGGVVNAPSALWSPCPGCSKCEPNDGYVLARDSGRPTRSHEYIFILAKAERYYWDAEAVREPSEMRPQNRHTDGRGAKDDGYATHRQAPGMTEPSGRNLRSVWTLNPRPFTAAKLGVTDTDHYAAFPPELPARCIAAGTSEHGTCAACGSPYARIVERDAAGRSLPRDGIDRGDDTRGRKARTGEAVSISVGWRKTCRCDTDAIQPAVVLDPFAGTGTVGEVAVGLGRSAILCELNPDYQRICRARCGLFVEAD